MKFYEIFCYCYSRTIITNVLKICQCHIFCSHNFVLSLWCHVKMAMNKGTFYISPNGGQSKLVDFIVSGQRYQYLISNWRWRHYYLIYIYFATFVKKNVKMRKNFWYYYKPCNAILYLNVWNCCLIGDL